MVADFGALKNLEAVCRFKVWLSPFNYDG